MFFETFIVYISIFTLCGLILTGLSIWIIEDDVYIYLYPNSYNFLWFLVMTNAFISISIIILITYKKTKTYIANQLIEFGDFIYLITIPFTFIMAVFWLGISSDFAKISNQCFGFKKRLNNTFSRKFTCTGELMISIFGFTIFVFYSILLISKILYIIRSYNFQRNVLDQIMGLRNQEQEQEQEQEQMQEIRHQEQQQEQFDDHGYEQQQDEVKTRIDLNV